MPVWVRGGFDEIPPQQNKRYTCANSFGAGVDIVSASFASKFLELVVTTTPGLVLTSTPLFLTGYYYLKRYGDERTALLAATAAVWLLAAHALYAVLISRGLSQGQLASSICCTLGAQALAVFWFGENFDLRKGVALAAILLASVVLALPAGGRA